MMEYGACDDEGFVERSLSIDAIEAHRRVLVRSIKDPIHDYSMFVFFIFLTAIGFFGIDDI